MEYLTEKPLYIVYFSALFSNQFMHGTPWDFNADLLQQLCKAFFFVSAEALGMLGMGKAAYDALLNALYRRAEHKVHIVLKEHVHGDGLFGRIVRYAVGRCECKGNFARAVAGYAAGAGYAALRPAGNALKLPCGYGRVGCEYFFNAALVLLPLWARAAA